MISIPPDASRGAMLCDRVAKVRGGRGKMDSVRIILIYTDHTSSTRGSQMAAISIAKTTTSTNMMAAPDRKQAHQKGSPMGHAFASISATNLHHKRKEIVCTHPSQPSSEKYGQNQAGTPICHSIRQYRQQTQAHKPEEHTHGLQHAPYRQHVYRSSDTVQGSSWA